MLHLCKMAFIEAASQGDIEKVKELLEDPTTNPAENDNEAIRMASGHGHTDVWRVDMGIPT